MALLLTPDGDYYTQAQLNRARRARETHKLCGHPNDHAFGLLLDNKGLDDTDVTSADLRLAMKILGPCEDCLRGKMTHWTTNIVSMDTQSLPPQRVGQHIHMDILFLGKIPYLLAYCGYCSFLLGSRLRSKATADLCSGIDRIIGYFAARKYTTDSVICDHEAAFKACTLHVQLTHRAMLLLKAPGHHARRVERQAGWLRGAIRVTTGALAFRLAAMFLESMVQYLIHRKNIVPSSITGLQSPTSIVNPGYRPSMKASLRLKFGDMVMCSYPGTIANVTQSAELAVFLYPVPLESQAMVYIFARGAARAADGFVYRDINPHMMKKVLTQDEHIILMNDLASSKGCITDLLPPYLDPIIPMTRSEISHQMSLEEDAPGDMPLPTQDPVLSPAQMTYDQPLVLPDQPPLPLPAIDVVASPPLSPTTNPMRPPLTPAKSPRGPVQWPADMQTVTASPPRSAMATPRSSSMVGERHPGSPIKPIPISFPPESLPPRTVEVPQTELPPSQPDSRPPTTGPTPPTRVTRSSTRAIPRQDYATLHSHGTRQAMVAAHILEARAKLKETLARFDKYSHQCRQEPELGPFAGLSTTLKKALREHPDAVHTAVETEFFNLVTLKKCIIPVDYATLTSSQRHKILYSFMFLTEKWTSDGQFDKLKARLAAGGDMQNSQSMTVDPSAPTVDFLTVQVILNLIAFHRMHSAVLDVTAAFLNADLDEELYICLDAATAQLFIRQFPQYRKWIRTNGSLICLVLKALYGMIQSAKLWYNHLRATLEAMGFTAVELGDKCLFYRQDDDGAYSYLLVYVDDLFISASSIALLDSILTALTKSYGQVTIQRGPRFSYLGMTIDISADRSTIRLSQQGYIQALLEEYAIVGVKKSPSPRNLMDAPSGPKAAPCDATEFRRKLMRTAYLSMRTRPDIRFTIQILATRSQAPRVHDMDCLVHLMMYLNLTRDYYTRLKPSDLQLKVYIDASFCIHPDGRGVTGVWAQMGVADDCGPVFVQSSKQKLLGKDSTACEIIAVDDGLYTIHQIESLMSAVLSPAQRPTLLEQDNASGITIMNNGHSNPKKSKYMLVRLQHIFEALTVEKSILTEWCPTTAMIADLMTKQLFGQQLIDLTYKCLNMTK